MALEYTGDLVSNSIGQVYVTLLDTAGTSPGRSINGSIQILDQNGQEFWAWQGNLLPHVTPEQSAWLQTFLDDLRVQAETELLP